MKCESCRLKFDPWTAKKVTIGKKVFVYCPHCGEMTRVG